MKLVLSGRIHRTVGLLFTHRRVSASSARDYSNSVLELEFVECTRLVHCNGETVSFDGTSLQLVNVLIMWRWCCRFWLVLHSQRLHEMFHSPSPILLLPVSLLYVVQVYGTRSLFELHGLHRMCNGDSISRCGINIVLSTLNQTFIVTFMMSKDGLRFCVLFKRMFSLTIYFLIKIYNIIFNL